METAINRETANITKVLIGIIFNYIKDRIKDATENLEQMFNIEKTGQLLNEIYNKNISNISQ